MIFYLFCSLVIPFATGFILVSLIDRSLFPVEMNLLMKSCLAIGIGLGISSTLFFFWLLFFPFKVYFVSFILLEIGLFLSILAVAYFIYTKMASNSSPPRYDNLPQNKLHRLYLILSCLFYSMLASTLVSFILLYLAAPHGNWDTFCFWNLRARFLFRGTEHWKDAFSPLINWSHPDYPVLLPGIVARSWKYLGNDNTLVPAAIALIFLFATLGLLCGSLTVLKSKGQGLLAGIFLLGTQHYILCAANQYADVPISFFFLSTIILFCVYDSKLTQNYYILILAGITAGLSAWTKNEGLLFIPALLVARLIIITPSIGSKPFFKQIVLFMLGLLPFILLILYFKIAISQPNDVISVGSIATSEPRLTNINRYFIIFKDLVNRIAKYALFNIIIIYCFLVGFDNYRTFKRSFLISLFILSLMFSGYYCIYLMTPYNVEWHIKHSFGRLCLQLWPSIIFSIFLITPTPESIIRGINSKY
jgi:hypothetical protein